MKAILSLLLFATISMAQTHEKPNILVILTDDLGFSDIGCYGSEIHTPVLDKLAANGLRFTQFYNTAKCHSSRVSLLSGRWCRQAGDESLKRAVTIPEVLRPAGYSNLMSGKWHLSKEPMDFGFDRYFGHLSGACSFFKGDNTFRLDREPWKVPDTGFYTTIAKVDFALEFLADARKEENPWLLYLAFNAPHAPVHALEQDYLKYRDRYTVGWDVIQQRRVQKLVDLGILEAETEVSPRPDHIPAWNDLPAELQDWESRRMAGYAGMIDRVDQELGRIVADLEKSGELDNTLIIFLSDNGACPYDRHNPGWQSEPHDPETRWTDSTGWAWARNAPFRFYKQNQYEGGIATPAIFHWPAGLKTAAGSLNHTPAHLVDLLPTLAEIGGAEIPTTFPGREPTPLAGVSLVPVLAGGALPSRPPIHLLHDRDRGLRDGDWKIVSFREGPWELYNIRQDRSQTQRPPRVVELPPGTRPPYRQSLTRLPFPSSGNPFHAESSMNPYPVLFAAVIAPAAAGDQRPIVEAYTHDLADPTKSRIAHVVIDGKWKLIEPGPVKPDRPFSNVPETSALFDLKADPLEKNDISKQHPEEVARLKALLVQSRK